MEDIVSKITDSLGPRWVQLYSRLGLDYRGRFQITANNKSIAPERVRYRQCALETIRKWQKEDALKEKDEKECMTILLNNLKAVKGLEGLANELANEHGIELASKSSAGSESHLSSSEDSQREESLDFKSLFQSYDWIWSQRINTNSKGHKFAILDICQRMTQNHFKQFCTHLGLEITRADAIIRDEPLLEERYYAALKEILDSGAVLTFNDLKDALLLCSRQDLVGLVIRRIEATRD